MEITINQISEITERLAGYHGLMVTFANEEMRDVLDIEINIEHGKIIQEVLSGEPRKRFCFNRVDE